MVEVIAVVRVIPVVAVAVVHLAVAVEHLVIGLIAARAEL